MSTKKQTSERQTQLQQDLQNELYTANHLLQSISLELQKIKKITEEDGEFEKNVSQNSSLIAKLAKMKHINLKTLPAFDRLQNHNREATSEIIDYQLPNDTSSNMDDT
ncbi:unnamed protein product [Leptidea sinapis]|uniref:Uncharacterized protein n=1 Tax=Leptidea sinapis TaxID=189913 RepID=A0A5E4Q441_9NEOP|nr:unnamed protein product [Leptidea sinapis]